MPEWEDGDTRGRRIAVALLAGVLVLALVVVGRVTGGGPDGQRLEVSENAGPPVTGGADSGGAAGRAPGPVGTWEPLPEAPLPPRHDHVAVWSGDSVLIWGGRDRGGWRADGASYDPAAGSWELLPEAPYLPYAGTRAVWDGERLVVLGFRGGHHAAYSPAAREWRPIEPPPDDGRWQAAAAIEGEVVLAGQRGGQTIAVAAAVGSGAWRELRDPPLEGGAYDLARVGGRLVLLSPGTGQELMLSALDPSTGRWSAPQEVPAGAHWSPSVTTDEAGYRVVVGGPSQGRGSSHAVWAWPVGSEDPDDWEVLPPLPRGLSHAAPELVDMGAGVIAWAPDDPGEGALLRVGEASWRPLALPGQEVAPGARAVWTGASLVVWGGDEASGAEWRPLRERAVSLPPPQAPRAQGSWRVLPESPDPRSAPAVVWTGRELVMWGGLTPRTGSMPADGARLDPRGGGWRDVAQAPITGRVEAVHAWLAGEMVVWGGRTEDGPARDGAAYDPDSDTWRALPPPPARLGAMAVGAVIGDELWVASGPDPAVAAYDPRADTWRDVVDPPPRAGTPIALVETPQGALLLTESSSWRLLRPAEQAWEPRGAHTLAGGALAGSADGVVVALGANGELARHEPARGLWRGAVRPWSPADPASAAWAGPRLVAWGAAHVGDYIGGRRGAAAYDPSADQWVVLPDPPPGVDARGPAVWTGTEVVFWAPGRALAFRPDRW